MNYFKSTGFFCLLYIFVFSFLSFSTVMFTADAPVMYIFTYFGLLLYAFLFMKLTGRDFKAVLRLRKPHIGSLFLVMLLSLTIRPAAGFISQLSQLIFHNITAGSMANQVSYGLVMMLFTTAILPGIVEELIFRGCVYSGLRKANPIKGIFLTALFFGLAHMNFQQFCYAFFLGLVFGLVLEATDSIFSTMLMHMLFNGASVGLTFLLSKMGSLEQLLAPEASAASASSLLTSIPAVLLSLVLSGLLLIVIARLNHRLGYMKTWLSKEARRGWPKEKATSISYFAALAICIFFACLYEISAYLM